MSLFEDARAVAGRVLEIAGGALSGAAPATLETEQRSAPSGWSALLDLLDSTPLQLQALGALKRSIATHRAISVGAGAIGSMPLKTYRDAKGGRVETTSQLLLEPHRSLTAYEWRELIATHLLSHGNAFLAIEKNQAGTPLYLDPLDPAACTVEKIKPTADNPQGRLYKVSVSTSASESKTVTLTPRECLHIPGLSLDGITGLSPIGAARVTAGAQVAAEEYAARLWSSGTLQQGFLSATGDIDEEQAKAMVAAWKSKVQGLGNARDVAVLSGVDFKALTIPNDDAQFLESRKFDAASIFGLYGLDENGEPRSAQAWLKFTLLPTLRRIESRLSRLLPRGQFAEFLTEGLLRADIAVRYPAYAVAIQNGWLGADEVREFENLEPRDDLKPLAAGTGTPNAQVTPARTDS